MSNTRRGKTYLSMPKAAFEQWKQYADLDISYSKADIVISLIISVLIPVFIFHVTGFHNTIVVCLFVFIFGLCWFKWYKKYKGFGKNIDSEVAEKLYLYDKKWILAISKNRWYSVNLDYEYLIVKNISNWLNQEENTQIEGMGLCLIEEKDYYNLKYALLEFSDIICAGSYQQSLIEMCERIKSKRLRKKRFLLDTIATGRIVAYGQLLLDMRLKCTDLLHLSIEAFEGQSDESYDADLSAGKNGWENVDALLDRIKIAVDNVYIIEPDSHK